MHNILARSKIKIHRFIATLWQYSYKAKYLFDKWRFRYYGIITFAVLFSFALISFFFSAQLNYLLAEHYAQEEKIEALRGLILNIGTALIGASAIITSLVLFAMQVNIERMPHGLFRRLSADSKLLGAFALSFFLAIGVAALSISLNHKNLGYMVLLAFWNVVFIVLSFIYAYKRALVLINPLQQLDILVQDTRKEFKTWSKRAKRATPLFENDNKEDTEPPVSDSTHNLALTAYFQINYRWDNGAKRALQHAISFARRYAEQGDHEVSAAAFNAVLALNYAYIKVKGKTFYGNNPFLDNPLSQDSFINSTLEHLRQNVQFGIARGDEQHILHTLRTIAGLVQAYLKIDYSTSNPLSSRSHAQLATEYLTSSVEAVVPHNMADVLMEGQRLIGQSARLILSEGDPGDIAVLSEKIALVACSGSLNEEYRPVTLEGMSQLANLTLNLLLCKNNDIHYLVKKIRQNVALVVKQFLKVNEPGFFRLHSSFLSPFYSSTNMNSLLARLTDLANAISDIQTENSDSAIIIRNIEIWADGLYQTEKDLLLTAIKSKSSFTSDMIYWITDITEILLFVSNTSVCNSRSKDELRRHALWLISSLTWIPDDCETITFVENFQMTEKLFESALSAYRHGDDDIANEIFKILLSWTFNGGKCPSSREILGKGLCYLSVLTLKFGDEHIKNYKESISTYLSGDNGPTAEIRENASKMIVERANSLGLHRYSFSLIDKEIDQVDHQKLRPLLQEIASLLSSN